MLKKAEQRLEKTIFNSRWLLAPFYLGLVLGIILLFIKFFQELWHMITHVLSASEADVIVGTLALIDMSLVASLLLIIIFSGYEIFVSKIDTANYEDRPQWMGKIDFSGLKLKVIGAIVAISAIDLLKVFNMAIAKVLVFIPPPVELGDAPTHIKKMVSIIVGNASASISAILNPAVRGVAAVNSPVITLP